MISKMQFGDIMNLVGPAAQIVLGIFVGLILNMVVQWKQSYNSKMNLRRALIAELSTIRFTLNNIPDNETDMSKVIEDLPRTVYESNASKIGGLSREEVNAITRFYSITSESTLYTIPAVESAMTTIKEVEPRIRETKSKLDNSSVKNTRIETEEEDLRELEATLDQLRKAVVEKQLDVLERRRGKAVENLRENLEN